MVLQDHMDVIHRWNMQTIKNEQELYEINGGINFSSSMLNAIATTARIVLEIGRSIGSALRRSTSKNVC